MKTFIYGSASGQNAGALGVPVHRCSKRCCTLVSQLNEDLGRMAAIRSSNPDALERLEAQALADSVEASTHIEGLYPGEGRVAAIVDDDEPVTDTEHQVAGLANATRMVLQHASELTVDTATILAIHERIFAYRGTSKRSRYRKRDQMDMIIDGVPQKVQVSPILAFETPLYLGSACDMLAGCLAATEAEGPLECEAVLPIPQFTVDFLCIRPFDEGNGRVVRLFGELLALRSGIDVSRYVSLNRIFERDGMRYYDALNACTQGWDANANTYEPFIEYWLEAIHEAYCQLFDSIEASAGSGLGKAQRVRDYFAKRPGSHAKREIIQANPDISVSTIENALAELVREGYLRKVGAGRSTAYERCNSEG